MDVVILAGGKGSRLGYLTKSIPKPMVKIGNKPIIWHLMKIFASQGHKNFIVCLGYKGNVLKKYFSKIKEDWNIKCIDTGQETLTAKRLYKIKKYISSKKFFMTYGDGLANISLKSLYKIHCKTKKIATVTAVSPLPRFGSLIIKKDIVVNFREKNKDNKNLINGGFFVLDKQIFKTLDLNKNVMWEMEPMASLTKKNQLSAYKHKGFWHPMDTDRDRDLLNKLYKVSPFWKTWK